MSVLNVLDIRDVPDCPTCGAGEPWWSGCGSTAAVGRFDDWCCRCCGAAYRTQEDPR